MKTDAAKQSELRQNTDFLLRTFRGSIFPCMLSLLSVNINVFVDGILVGNRIGSDALAAISLSLPFYLFLCVVGSFFSSGTAIPASQAIGRGEEHLSQQYYQTCCTSMCVISILITAAGLLLRRPLVSFLCTDSTIRPYVMDYIVITIIGALPKIMIYIPFWYLRLDGKNSAVTAMMAVMTAGNILLDILFIYYLDMGVFGAGLASVIATAAAFIMGMVFLHSKACFFSFRPFCFRTLHEWKIITRAGTPSALNNLCGTVRLLLVNSILLRIGGGTLVAVFTAVNGIAGFGECITLGVPQAAGAMLGVFSGERDNGSSRLLIRMECLTGMIFSGIFLVLCLALSGPIRMMYGLHESLLLPLFWMALSIFPALLCCVLSSYYNMTGKNFWSNAIIVCRTIAMTWLGLTAVSAMHLSEFSFLLFAELATLLLWLLAVRLYHRKHQNITPWLLMDTSLEQSGEVLNFSVNADSESICSAAEQIMDFCGNNGMNRRQTMQIQLAMEESMTLISQVNQKSDAAPLSFDLRAYSVNHVTGIRIRYGGIAYNPFSHRDEDADMYMGILMLEKMIEFSNYQRTFGTNTLQIVLKEEGSYGTNQNGSRK